LSQACAGVLYEIPLNVKMICYKCDGTRNEMGYQGNICPYCEGTGVETVKVSPVGY
jgi:DnaJ-class molecular chaperone